MTKKSDRTMYSSADANRLHSNYNRLCSLSMTKAEEDGLNAEEGECGE
jgi:hypothetical protein